MAKQIYNFELFTNKKEELRRIQQRARQRQRMKQIALLAVLLLLLVIGYILQNSRSEYYSYKEVTQTGDNTDVAYEYFQKGYLKYSADGIEYEKKFGAAEWNEPVSYKNPVLITSEKYAILMDKENNQLSLYDKDGLVNNFTLKCPVVQATVSDEGNVEVVLEGNDLNYIQLYNKEEI